MRMYLHHIYSTLMYRTAGLELKRCSCNVCLLLFSSSTKREIRLLYVPAAACSTICTYVHSRQRLETQVRSQKQKHCMHAYQAFRNMQGEPLVLCRQNAVAQLENTLVSYRQACSNLLFQNLPSSLQRRILQLQRMDFEIRRERTGSAAGMG